MDFLSSQFKQGKLEIDSFEHPIDTMLKAELGGTALQVDEAKFMDKLRAKIHRIKTESEQGAFKDIDSEDRSL